jgi:hypothetical protein
MGYYRFSKEHFEYKLKDMLFKHNAGFMEDITWNWRKEGNVTWERIYKISTKNRAVDIIVFSSIDISTGRARDVGGDAVRLVLRWKTTNGNLYKRLAKHYRVDTLFDNLKETVLDAQANVFNLKAWEFAREFKETVA